MVWGLKHVIMRRILVVIGETSDVMLELISNVSTR